MFTRIFPLLRLSDFPLPLQGGLTAVTPTVSIEMNEQREKSDFSDGI